MRTLRSLYICDAIFAPSPIPVLFPSLHHLALSFVTADPPTFRSMFSVSSLPSLKTLVAEHFSDVDADENDGTYLPPLPPALLDQLSFLRVQHGDLSWDTPAELRARDNLLVEIDYMQLMHWDNAPPFLDLLGALRAPYMRYPHSPENNGSGGLDPVREGLQGLAEVLQQPFRPREVHLCPSLLPHTLPAGDPLRAAVLGVLAVAAEKDVQVVWRRQPIGVKNQMHFWREEMADMEAARRWVEEAE
ncbi:hypothetical protein JCM10213v2_003370 [Rhodosporidiobolus nylandii]